MPASKPLTIEMMRILHAAKDGQLVTNNVGRWIYADRSDIRPDAASRRKLVSRGYLRMWVYGKKGPQLTEKGIAAIEAEEPHYNAKART